MKPLAGPRLVAPLVLLALSFACAGAPTAEPRRESISSELLPFLLEPAADAADADSLGARSLHRQLLDGMDALEVVRAAAALAARRTDLAAAQVVLAQAQLVAGQPGEALRSARAPGAVATLAARLVAARALEATGDLASAVEAYSELAEVPAAAERARQLQTRAIEILTARVHDATARGVLDTAESELARLERLSPRSEATLELALRLARLREDRARELAIIRSLSAAAPQRADLLRRRAQLETEVGDARAGLELYGELVAAAPDDVTLGDEHRRASFRWRVLNSPEPVRRAAESPQASRADFALMLYWLVPQVRTSRGGTPRIASDVLDHPAREEIVRVVNLGLLPVEEPLHLFQPSRPGRRVELLRALVELIADRDPQGCAASVGAAGSAREDVCLTAARCGLIAGPTDCLPGGPCSGAEAQELVRLALERLEAP